MTWSLTRAEPGLTADFADVRIATPQSPEPSQGTGRIVAMRNGPGGARPSQRLGGMQARMDSHATRIGCLRIAIPG